MALTCNITDLQIGRDRRSIVVCTGLDFRVVGLLDSTAIMYRMDSCVRAGMLAGSNLVFPTNGETVRIWDDAQHREVGILQGKSNPEEDGFGPVQKVLASKNIIAVIGSTGLVLYSLPKLSIFGSVKVPELSLKVDACDIDREGTVLVRPGRADGVLHVEFASGGANGLRENASGVYEIHAHQHPLRIARLSDNGKLIATASVHGTLVRVFDTASSNKVAEFRCGRTTDDIHGLEFDATGNLLLVACGRTLHVFSLTSTSELSSLDNSRSLMRYLPLAPSYYNSTWSARQYDLDKYSGASFDGGYVCGFTDDNSHIVVLMKSGTRILFPFLNTGQLAPADAMPVLSRFT